MFTAGVIAENYGLYDLDNNPCSDLVENVISNFLKENNIKDDPYYYIASDGEIRVYNREVADIALENFIYRLSMVPSCDGVYNITLSDRTGNQIEYSFYHKRLSAKILDFNEFKKRKETNKC